jgi:predicted amidohydrolase
VAPIARRLGLLHLAPEVGQLERNRAAIERGTDQAAAMGAEWIISGELVVPGYSFADVIGTAWIEARPDPWLQHYASRARNLGVALFVSHPERVGELLYNSMFAIDRTGEVVGAHRKICVTPGSEDWSTPGDSVEAAMVDGVSVGLLVCADAYPTGPAKQLQEQGAQVLVSSAAWHPGAWGPSGEWEQRSLDTGLPLVVCNRTGVDGDASFTEAVSVVVDRGRRITSLQSPESTVFVVDLAIDPTGTTAALVDRRPLD